MKNLNISSRLIASFALLVALLVGVIGVALWQMAAMRAVTKEITSNRLVAVEHVNQMNTGTSDYRIGEYQHVLNTDEKNMASIEKSMSDVLVQFEKDHKTYVATISSPEEQKLYDAFAAEWKQYLQIHEQVIALSRKNENEKAKALLDGGSKAVRQFQCQIAQADRAQQRGCCRLHQRQ